MNVVKWRTIRECVTATSLSRQAIIDRINRGNLESKLLDGQLLVSAASLARLAAVLKQSNEDEGSNERTR
jgi:hypothetical protein